MLRRFMARSCSCLGCFDELRLLMSLLIVTLHCDHWLCYVRSIGHCAACAVSGFVQLWSGLNDVIASATLSVACPRSFWNTVPSWLTMKVMTPELRYSAG